MATAKSVRIDPFAIQQQSIGTKPRAASVGTSFKSALSAADVAAPFAPLMGELTYQATGSPNAAAVLHSAFSALPLAFGSGKGAYAGAALGDLPGMMGSPSYASYSGGGAYGGSGTVPGTDVPQAELIDQMNTNNLQLLELQAVMQNNMQQWTTKSNILKSVHESKMSMINKFAVHQ